MKTKLLGIVIATASPLLWADVTESTTTTTTTEGTGAITEFTPGRTIVLKEANGPISYRFSKHITYVDREGNPIAPAEVRTRIRVGVPVRVHYLRNGDQMMVDRVIVDQTAPSAPPE